jgi:multidrug efflux pump subunit AcrB
VVVVVGLFLRSWRATLIPAAAVIARCWARWA